MTTLYSIVSIGSFINYSSVDSSQASLQSVFGWTGQNGRLLAARGTWPIHFSRSRLAGVKFVVLLVVTTSTLLLGPDDWAGYRLPVLTHSCMPGHASLTSILQLAAGRAWVRTRPVTARACRRLNTATQTETLPAKSFGGDEELTNSVSALESQTKCVTILVAVVRLG